MLTARAATAREGILMGESCGTALWAALQLARELDDPDALFVVLLPDCGRNYVGKLYNDDWLRERACSARTSRWRATTGARREPKSCCAAPRSRGAVDGGAQDRGRTRRGRPRPRGVELALTQDWERTRPNDTGSRAAGGDTGDRAEPSRSATGSTEPGSRGLRPAAARSTTRPPVRRKKVDFASVEEVDAAVAVATAAFPAGARPASASAPRSCSASGTWSTASRGDRRAPDRRARQVRTDALGEVARGLENIEFACGIPHLFKGGFSEQASRGIDVYQIRQPLGVVAGITPFNFPAMVPMWMFANAIACGNTFILKPSEKDPSASVYWPSC